MLNNNKKLKLLNFKIIIISIIFKYIYKIHVCNMDNNNFRRVEKKEHNAGTITFYSYK